MPTGIYLHKPMSQSTKDKIAEGKCGDRNPAKRPEVRAKISAAQKGKKRTEEWKERMRQITLKNGNKPPNMKGAKYGPMTEEHRKKISISRKGIRVSEEAKKKIGIKSKGRKKSPETIKRLKESLKKHYDLKGRKIYKRPQHAGIEYREWRQAVFKRDDYTCQICKQKGGQLNADHIKRFSDYPELRLNLDNGRTLCVPCHKKTDTYGRRKIIITIDFIN